MNKNKRKKEIIYKKKNECVKKKYYKISFLVMLLVNLIKIIPAYEWLPDFWRSYILNYYVLSYQVAGHFVSRALVGSVTTLFVQRIDSRIFYAIFWIFYIFVYCFIACKLLKQIEKEDNSLLYFLIVAITVFNPAVMNYAADFARPDVFMVIISLICLHIISREKFTFLVPFLCIIGMLIHEGFIVIFVPLVATYLLEKIVKNPNLKNVLGFIFLIISAIVTLVLIFKFGKNGIVDVGEFQRILQDKIDIDLNPNMIYFEYGSSAGELGNISFNELSYYKTQIGLFFYLFIFLPIIITYIVMLKSNWSSEKNKIIYLLYSIAPFSGLMMIIVGVDYGRWFSMSISCCLIRMYYYLADRKISLTYALKIVDTSKATLIATVILGIYLVIGPMGDIYEHFEYLNYLNNMLNYFKGFF